MENNDNTSLQARKFVHTILISLPDLTKPVRKFMRQLFQLWWSNPGRSNFTNLSRLGSYTEKSLRLGFGRGFDFFTFNRQVLKQHPGTYILAFDPSFIRKSGKQTHGLGWFWNGKQQRVEKGLELSVLAAVEVTQNTAFHLKAVQTPATEKRKADALSLVQHYLQIIIQDARALQQISTYLVVDGYFMKKEFILPLCKEGFRVITKARSDANLMYLFKGKQKQGRGRNRLYDGKVNLQNIDHRRWTCFDKDEHFSCSTALVYSVQLKMKVRVVHIFHRSTGRYEVLVSTDTDLEPENILLYYRRRFQIEFLFRDAKQHAGLEEGQARDEKKMHFHFNMALSTVSIAKAAFLWQNPNAEMNQFSLTDFKRLCHNQFITETIFRKLGLDMNQQKTKQLYLECLKIGRIAA